MYNYTTTSVSTSTSDLSTRIVCAANDQMDDYLQADRDMRYMSSTRTRHHALVNATHRVMDAADIIAFYEKRYGVPATAPAPYTVADKLRDIRAAGIPAWMESVICRKTITRADVLAACDAYRDDCADRRARSMATLARISSSQVVA